MIARKASSVRSSLAQGLSGPRSHWPPLHVERGFEPGDSVVTAFPATSGPQLIVDQKSRSAEQLAGSFGLGQ